MSETARARAYAEGYADGKRDVAACFTWEDVDMLRAISASLDRGHNWPWESLEATYGETDGSPNVLRHLADRLAALLPPREQ
jgi:hypothetical protein